MSCRCSVSKRESLALLRAHSLRKSFRVPVETLIAICQRGLQELCVPGSQIVQVQWTELMGSIKRLYLTDAIYLTIS